MHSLLLLSFRSRQDGDRALTVSASSSDAIHGPFARIAHIDPRGEKVQFIVLTLEMDTW